MTTRLDMVGVLAKQLSSYVTNYTLDADFMNSCTVYGMR